MPPDHGESQTRVTHTWLGVNGHLFVVCATFSDVSAHAAQVGATHVIELFKATNLISFAAMLIVIVIPRLPLAF